MTVADLARKLIDCNSKKVDQILQVLLLPDGKLPKNIMFCFLSKSFHMVCNRLRVLKSHYLQMLTSVPPNHAKMEVNV